jgi:hypothetical protein
MPPTILQPEGPCNTSTRANTHSRPCGEQCVKQLGVHVPRQAVTGWDGVLAAVAQCMLDVSKLMYCPP